MKYWSSSGIIKEQINMNKQESVANAKVSVRQQCMYEGPSEIYGKSTQGT